MKIAVVIPTYNEKENIAAMVDSVFQQGIDGLEMIIVDDNSPDGTGDMVEKIAENNPKVHLISRPQKMGLGTAYIDGFRFALEKNAELIVEMDADFSHDPKMIPVFLKNLEEHDLVIGSRYLNGITIVNWPLRRLALSYLANIYARIATGLKTKDLTSGFKGYRRKVIESINLDDIKSNGYAFQIEMKYRAAKSGFSMTEIPIIFVDRHSGTSKISRHEIIEAFFIVWRLRFPKISKRKNNSSHPRKNGLPPLPKK